MYASNGGLPFGAGHASAGDRRAGAGVVPGRGRDRRLLRPVRADRQPERRDRRPLGDLPAAERHHGGPHVSGGPQAALHHLRRPGEPPPGQHGGLDDRPLDQRRAGDRRARDVVAGAGLWRELVARGAQLARLDGDGRALGAGGGRAGRRPTTPRPTSSSPTPARRPPRPGSRSTTRTAAPRRRRWPCGARVARPCASPPAFPDAAGRRFGTIVESIAGSTALVVERAMYTSVGGDSLGRRHQRPRHAD